MQALSRRKVRSFLLTSGTLSPLASFAAELRLPFPISLENPHVIAPDQAHIPPIPQHLSRSLLAPNCQLPFELMRSMS